MPADNRNPPAVVDCDPILNGFPANIGEPLHKFLRFAVAPGPPIATIRWRPADRSPYDAGELMTQTTQQAARLPRLLLLVGVSLGLAASTTNAAVTKTTPFIGVTHYDVTITSPQTARYHLIAIDTTAPGIGFETTGSNGADPGETTGETTLNYVQRTGAKIGINGSFFTDAGSNGSTVYRGLVQIATSAGQQVSPWSGSTDGREAALNISASNIPSIIYPTANNTLANSFATTAGITPYTSLGGNYSILKNGVATGETDGNAPINAHTVVGVSGRTLFLFTVDKGQANSVGLTGPQIGTILLTYGVTDAVNLDGGGSTTLVMPVAPGPFGGGGLSVINAPSDGVPRLTGNNFAVFATVPEPGLAVASGAISIALLKRRRALTT